MSLFCAAEELKGRKSYLHFKNSKCIQSKKKLTLPFHNAVIAGKVKSTACIMQLEAADDLQGGFHKRS